MKQICFFISILLTSSIVFGDETTQTATIPSTSPSASNLLIDETQLLAAACAPKVRAACPEDDTNTVQDRVLRNFIESRGLIECREKSGRLTLAGDVRARWTNCSETIKGHSRRGARTGNGHNQFRTEVNLFMDYACPCTWLTTKLRWNNTEGVDCGASTKICIDRAFIGYDLYCCGDTDFYLELGRSNLGYIFDSQVQFSSNFTGLHLYYTSCIPHFGTFVVHGGPFIVDSIVNNYAWIGELCLRKWRGTNFGFKYSLVDWRRRSSTKYCGNLTKDEKDNHFGKNSGIFIHNNPRYRFLVSQMLFIYERPVNFCRCKTFYAYGAVLANHDARGTFTTNWKKLNRGWYTGFTLGRLCKAGDWSFDIHYQSVQAQAVPDFDFGGIGRGNVDDLLLSDAIILGLGPDKAFGFANYKGWEVSLLYAITNSLSLRAKGVTARPLDRVIGKDFKFDCFDFTVIYAF